MNEVCFEIIKRGGIITTDEWNVLLKVAQYKSLNYSCEYYREFAAFYLKEAGGYCVIGASPFWEVDEPSSREEIEQILKEDNMPGVLEMEYFNLSRSKKFHSYDELMEYHEEVLAEMKFIDPMSDPKFRAIYEKGYMENDEEYYVFYRYAQYGNISRETATIELPDGCSEIEIAFNHDWWDPWGVDIDSHKHEKGFREKVMGRYAENNSMLSDDHDFII